MNESKKNQQTTLNFMDIVSLRRFETELKVIGFNQKHFILLLAGILMTYHFNIICNYLQKHKFFFDL